jgi:hypothetical protein
MFFFGVVGAEWVKTRFFEVVLCSCRSIVRKQAMLFHVQAPGQGGQPLAPAAEVDLNPEPENEETGVRERPRVS